MDRFGDLCRGCTKCGCKEYTTPEKKSKLKCAFCGHFPIKHIQLDHPIQFEQSSICIESNPQSSIFIESDPMQIEDTFSESADPMQVQVEDVEDPSIESDYIQVEYLEDSSIDPSW